MHHSGQILRSRSLAPETTGEFASELAALGGMLARSRVRFGRVWDASPVDACRRVHAGLYSVAPGLVLFAQAEHGAGEDEGNFLVTPNVGLMIWTVIAFGITMWILARFAFPRIGEALDKRARTISESVEAAERQRREADELLAEYRKRLTEAREQADDIIARARKAAETVKSEAASEGHAKREELVAAARKDIEVETRRSLERIRKEVADLTVMATEKVTRKSLDPDDHRRLIEEALTETDFSALVPEGNGAEQA